MVVLDATFLMLLFRPNVGVSKDPSTGEPVDRISDRIAYLVSTIEKSKSKIAIPTPALSEILVRAGEKAAVRIVEEINKAAVFRIIPFDTLAAIEVAAMTRAALAGGDKRLSITN